MYTVRIFLSVVLAFLMTIISQPEISSAQQNTNNVPIVERNLTEDSESALSNRSDRLQWLWLLPLLTIPLVFWGLRKMEESDNSRYYDPEIAGVKGGKSSDENTDENQNFEKILL